MGLGSMGKNPERCPWYKTGRLTARLGNINRNKQTFCVILKSSVPQQKFKNQPRPLVRLSYENVCQIFLNLFLETVPLTSFYLQIWSTLPIPFKCHFNLDPLTHLLFLRPFKNENEICHGSGNAQANFDLLGEGGGSQIRAFLKVKKVSRTQTQYRVVLKIT